MSAPVPVISLYAQEILLILGELAQYVQPASHFSRQMVHKEVPDTLPGCFLEPALPEHGQGLYNDRHRYSPPFTAIHCFIATCYDHICPALPARHGT